jgi:glycine/D-amino acid oxidase-like deaminating enzyme
LFGLVVSVHEIALKRERNLVRCLPAFGNVKVAERWTGVIDATPDGVPVISEVPSLPGFYIASGFSWHGFGVGPGAGHLW